VGSSNLDYRGAGFWVRDFQAEVWLWLLADEAARLPDAPVWLADAREDWLVQATAGFMGCLSSGLDDHLGTDAERVALTLELAGKVMRRLTAWSPAIPKDLVNSFGTGGEPESFDHDLDTDQVLACGRAFITLLRGEFSPGYDRWAR
jgi:hypothetical protein